MWTGRPAQGLFRPGLLSSRGARPLRPGFVPAGEVGAVHVAAIIPAYNEEETVGKVIDTVRRVPEVDEIIVISDGSTDATAEVARRHGATVIALEHNLGKGGAMKVGLDRADADVFIFLDADLVGLEPAHVSALLAPVLSGEAGMSIGLFDGGRVATDLAQVVAPYLSGQRAVHRDVLLGVSGLEMARFGVEMALTRHIKEHHIPVAHVTLPNLTHRTKEEKLGILRGFLARLKMYWEILRFTQGEIARELLEVPAPVKARMRARARATRRLLRRGLAGKPEGRQKEAES